MGAQSEGLGKLIQTIMQERNALWMSGVGPTGVSSGSGGSAGAPPAPSEGVSFSLYCAQISRKESVVFPHVSARRVRTDVAGL